MHVSAFALCLTSKMSHAHGGHDSCSHRFRIPLLHFDSPSLARGMTDVGVGSGALLGFFRPKLPNPNLWFRRTRFRDQISSLASVFPIRSPIEHLLLVLQKWHRRFGSFKRKSGDAAQVEWLSDVHEVDG